MIRKHSQGALTGSMDMSMLSSVNADPTKSEAARIKKRQGSATLKARTAKRINARHEDFLKNQRERLDAILQEP